MVRWIALVGAGLLAGCGTELVGRTFELEVRGLSARASALVVKLRGETLNCREITLDAVAALEADEEQRWDRASGADRTLSLSPLTTREATLVAYALDAAGAPFQVACRAVTYEELGNLAGGRVVLVLSRRPAAAALEPR